MKTREEILVGLGSAKSELQERFRVRTLALFGSYARNQQTERSDVDILVEVDPSIGLGFVSLAEELERRGLRSVPEVPPSSHRRQRQGHHQRESEASAAACSCGQSGVPASTRRGRNSSAAPSTAAASADAPAGPSPLLLLVLGGAAAWLMFGGRRG